MPDAQLVIRREDLLRAVLPTVLRGIRQRGRDLRPAWPFVLNIIYSYEAQLFRQQGETPDTPRWAPLSPGYQEWKDRKAPGRGILELTGKLMRQLSGEGGAVVRSMRTKLELHTDIPLKWSGGIDDLGGIHMSGRPGAGPGAIHNLRIGGQAGSGKQIYNTPMPARPPIELQDGEINEIVDVLSGWVVVGSLPERRGHG